MKEISIIGFIFTIGLLVFLKVFQDAIPRISDPITNTIVFAGFVIFAVIYGVSQIKKAD